MIDKNKDNNLDDTLDWEYMSEFYGEENKKEVRSFEDFLDEYKESDEFSEEESFLKDDQLKKIVSDVKNVRELSGSGNNIEQIANILSLEINYVTTILITINGSPEDNSDISIAHLVMMDL